MKSFVASALTATVLALVHSSPLGLRNAPQLTVEIKAPASVSSLDDMKVTSSVTNSGSQSIKVLTYNTPLSPSLVQNFDLSKDGSSVAFTGVRSLFQLSAVENLDDVFTTISPGETVTVTHDIGAIFDFATTGDYAIESTNKFLYISDADATPRSLDDLSVLEASSNKITVNVGNVEKRDLGFELEKRDRTSGCSSSQSSFIFSALSEGKALAQQSANYISSHGANSLFTTYFGTSSTTTVRNVFSAVGGIDAANDGQSTTIYCNDPYSDCGNGVIAYSVPSNGVLAVCSIFFQEVPSTQLCNGGTTVAARNVRGATLLHEETHLLAGTVDYGYGVSFDQNLARSNPSEARNNADNYNVFAESVYAASC